MAKFSFVPYIIPTIRSSMRPIMLLYSILKITSSHMDIKNYFPVPNDDKAVESFEISGNYPENSPTLTYRFVLRQYLSNPFVLKVSKYVA